MSVKDYGGSPAHGLFGATLGFFLGFAAVSLFGPTAYKFKEATDLNPVMLGLLVAIPSLSGSLLRIPFGAWADTAGARKPFLVLLTLSFLGMLSLFLVLYFLYPNNLGLSYYPLLLLLGVLCGWWHRHLHLPGLPPLYQAGACLQLPLCVRHPALHIHEKLCGAEKVKAPSMPRVVYIVSFSICRQGSPSDRKGMTM